VIELGGFGKAPHFSTNQTHITLILYIISMVYNKYY
jgi:hypothetical protein